MSETTGAEAFLWMLVIVISIAVALISLIVWAVSRWTQWRDDRQDRLQRAYYGRHATVGQLSAAPTVQIPRVPAASTDDEERRRAHEWSVTINTQIAEINERFARLVADDPPIEWLPLAGAFEDVELRAVNRLVTTADQAVAWLQRDSTRSQFSWSTAEYKIVSPASRELVNA